MMTFYQRAFASDDRHYYRVHNNLQNERILHGTNICYMLPNFIIGDEAFQLTQKVLDNIKGIKPSWVLKNEYSTIAFISY